MVECPVLRVNETPIHTNFTKKIAGNIAKVKPKGITFITVYPPIDHAINSSYFYGRHFLPNLEYHEYVTFIR